MATTYTTQTPANADDIRVMAGCNDALLAVGRILLAVIFLMSGFQKFMDLSGVAAMIGSERTWAQVTTRTTPGICKTGMRSQYAKFTNR